MSQLKIFQLENYQTKSDLPGRISIAINEKLFRKTMLLFLFVFISFVGRWQIFYKGQVGSSKSIYR